MSIFRGLQEGPRLNIDSLYYETVESPAAPIVPSCHLIGNSSERKCIFLPGDVVPSLGPFSESCFFIDSERIH